MPEGKRSREAATTLTGDLARIQVCAAIPFQSGAAPQPVLRSNWVPDGNAQGEEASFLRRLVPPPDIRAEISDPRRVPAA